MCSEGKLRYPLCSQHNTTQLTMQKEGRCTSRGIDVLSSGRYTQMPCRPWRANPGSFFSEGGVGLVPKRACLLTLAYYAFPRWYEFGERRWNDILTGETEELGEKPVPVPPCPPQIRHGMTRARTRASAVRGRRLTTWAMARTLATVTETHIPHSISNLYFIYFKHKFLITMHFDNPWTLWKYAV
jgi:hypothetical protein